MLPIFCLSAPPPESVNSLPVRPGCGTRPHHPPVAHRKPRGLAQLEEFSACVLGFVGVRLLLAISPGSIPRIGEDGSAVTLDLNVLLFTLGVSVLTGILFGLIPAISASRNNLAAALNESNSRSSAGFRSGKIRSFLVISEMALALVLVVGATLLIRTFMKLQSVDPGFDSHNVVTMAMSIGASVSRRPRVSRRSFAMAPSGSTPCPA